MNIKPSSIPQSSGIKNMSRILLETPPSRTRTGTGYNWLNMDNYPYNETGKPYRDISKNPSAEFNIVRGDAIPQNTLFGRTIYNPPHRHMPFLHGAYNKTNKILY